MTLEAGTHIGKYVVRRKLAEGGMAEIYLCTARGAEGFEKEVVIKRVRAFLASDPEFVGMFIAEARLASRLNHANVVQIFDFDKHEDTYYLAMEYVRGCSLWELRKRGKELMEPVPPMLVAHIGAEVARGLHYAHRVRVNGQPLDLVHRDVTPHNVLLSFDGAVKLTDFGIAKAGNKLTQPGVLKGKFAYMSPEQARGEAVDARTDIFALGVVLWEMLTGGRLFDGDSEVAVLRAVQLSTIPPPARLNPDVPADLDAAVVRALDRDPALRFQTAAEFERALAQCVLTHARSVDDTDLSAFMRRLFPTSLTQAIPTVQERTHVVEGAPAPGAGVGAVPREPTAVLAPPGRSGLALPTSPDEDVNAPTFVLPRRGEEAALDAAPLPPMATPMMPLPAVASSPVPRGAAFEGTPSTPGRQSRPEGMAAVSGPRSGGAEEARGAASSEDSRAEQPPGRSSGVPAVAGSARTPSRPDGSAAVASPSGPSGSLRLASAWDDEDDDEEGTPSNTEPESHPGEWAAEPDASEVPAAGARASGPAARAASVRVSGPETLAASARGPGAEVPATGARASGPETLAVSAHGSRAELPAAGARASGPVAPVSVPTARRPWALGLSVALGLAVVGGGLAVMRGTGATPPVTPAEPVVAAPVVDEAVPEEQPAPSAVPGNAGSGEKAPAGAADAEAEVDGLMREEVLAAATTHPPADPTPGTPEPQETTRVRAAPASGTLQVQAAPYATVFINGKRMGEVTGRASYRLPAGNHKLVFQHPSGERRYDVAVTAGGTVSREFRAPKGR
ncbi:serine/threonine protein kinase [Myxococcus sp. SDU36]|uniref:serine/threonine-protein kinase n=1 Tax=Myxococcus sp. SDU36 TaxID=2831967 RepID=UPI00254391FC|nr:serine/threonine protein kinase [Myxococcus sp. SDU36]WIG96547.1 protein kinase [Myxococcus sp. SDU36]